MHAAPAADTSDTHTSGHASTPSEDQVKQAARAEVGAGSQAFQAGDYRAAIEHYAAAIALRPAPKLHYNIAVCHQRLSLAAEDPEQRTRERDLAIASYNAYLEQNPRAEDRLEVAQTIRELGGTPATMPGLKPFDASDDAREVETSDGDPQTEGELPSTTEATPPSDTTPTPAPAQPPRPYPHHGRLGVSMLGGVSPTLHAASAVNARTLFAFELHAGGFVGPRRRMLLAAHTSLFSGATPSADRLSFYGWAIGLLAQQTWVVGRQPSEALQIGLGAIVGVTGQGISERPDVAAPDCRLDNRGAQVAGHTGGQLAPRFDLGVLMGPRRRAVLGLIVQPTFAVFGDGPTASACQADQTPWTALGIRRRWQFQFWAGAGFALRF